MERTPFALTEFPVPDAMRLDYEGWFTEENNHRLSTSQPFGLDDPEGVLFRTYCWQYWREESGTWDAFSEYADLDAFQQLPLAQGERTVASVIGAAPEEFIDFYSRVFLPAFARCVPPAASGHARTGPGLPEVFGPGDRTVPDTSDRVTAMIAKIRQETGDRPSQLALAAYLKEEWGDDTERRLKSEDFAGVPAGRELRAEYEQQITWVSDIFRGIGNFDELGPESRKDYQYLCKGVESAYKRWEGECDPVEVVREGAGTPDDPHVVLWQDGTLYFATQGKPSFPPVGGEKWCRAKVGRWHVMVKITGGLPSDHPLVEAQERTEQKRREVVKWVSRLPILESVGTGHGKPPAALLDGTCYVMELSWRPAAPECFGEPWYRVRLGEVVRLMRLGPEFKAFAGAVREATHRQLAIHHGKKLRWMLSGPCLFAFKDDEDFDSFYGAAYRINADRNAPGGEMMFHQGGMFNTMPRAWLSGVPEDRKDDVRRALRDLCKQVRFDESKRPPAPSRTVPGYGPHSDL
ncbi:hypothetical protein AB0N09_33205 [Streptomyces erythrochromogenes]|uniref:hypothetical protein n=1 Tax=Streptomyces erythrochromogenes TaxID=285574 RepID=UPI00343C0166